MDVEVVAVQQGRAEQRPLPHRKHSDIKRFAMPENRSGMHIHRTAAVVGKVSVEFLIEWQVKSGDYLGGQCQRALKAGVYDELDLDALLIWQ